MSATLAQLSNARRAAPITSLPVLVFAGGELSELEKATMIGRASQRRATIPAPSRYWRVYARDGACALRSATNATMALSILRLMLIADPSNAVHRPILLRLSRKGVQ